MLWGHAMACPYGLYAPSTLNQLRIPGAGGGLIRVPHMRDYEKQKDYLIKMTQAQQQSAKAAAKKRIVKVNSYGYAHINATFNNIIISITNKNGQVISWSSAGKMGFKGSKKNTPYAAQLASSD